MRPLEELVRPNIRALRPYSTARDEYAGDECAGSAVQTWLDANENPFENGINRCPDPHQRRLKRQIAALKGIGEERIFLGNGSDEAIDLAYRIFCVPGRDNAVSISPTYGMYRVAADTNDVELREVPLGEGFSLPVEALLAAADERTKLLWLPMRRCGRPARKPGAWRACVSGWPSPRNPSRNFSQGSNTPTTSTPSHRRRPPNGSDGPAPGRPP